MFQKSSWLLAVTFLVMSFQQKVIANSYGLSELRELPKNSLLISQTKYPSVAKVTSMNMGDIMCYVTLVDDRGTKYEGVGAEFELCEQQNNFLNRRVNLTYKQVSVSDCRSAEPCGRSRMQTLITSMSPL